MARQKCEFFTWMGPTLDALRELGGSGRPREVLDLIAERLDIADKTLEEMLKSGQTRYYNQVHWARQYLVWEGLLDDSTNGVWALTPKGYERSLNDAEARKIYQKWAKTRSAARKKKQDVHAASTADLEPEGESHEHVLL